jgi:acyl carrier protein
MPAITPETVEQSITAAIATFGPDLADITRDATLEHLDVDSLDLVELAQIVEDDYGVELHSDDLREVRTVGDVVDAIVRRAAA